MSIAIDLIKPRGLELAKQLVIQADIVVENFAGGVGEKMGLGYEALKVVKPDIIMLSSCMQGQTGPHSRHPGYRIQLVNLSGLSGISGWPDRDPAGIGPYTDYTAPHNVYHCRWEDRWCVIAVCTDEEWERFCNGVDHPEWIKDPRFATFEARKENEEELDKFIGAWTLTHSPKAVMEMMQDAGVAAGVVSTGEDLLEHDEQLKHRKYWQRLEHTEIGDGVYYGAAPSFIMSKCPWEITRAPLMGEHNEYILKEKFGMSDEEIKELITSEVVN